MGGSSQDTQRLAQLVDKQKVDFDKVIDKANGKQDGQVIGVAVTPQSDSQGKSDQDAVAHVYIFHENQIHDVVVDSKADKVLDTHTRQTLSNPWQKGGAAGMQQQATSGTLSSDRADRLASQAKDDSVDLKKVISQAQDEAKDSHAVGAFLVPSSDISTQVRQSSDAQKPNLFAKVYAVDKKNQLRGMILDAKDNEVLHTETRQGLSSPWQSGAGTSGMGGSSGTSGQGQQGMGGQRDSSQQGSQQRSSQQGYGGSQQAQPGQSSGQPGSSGY
jgi:hypothetical protein